MTEQVMATEEFVGDFLEHYGVPGMRWGHRKAAGEKRARPTSAQIRDARAKTASRERQITDQIDRFNLTKDGSAAEKREGAKLSKMQADYLKNPDRATAQRMTRGEKVALALLAVAVPGAGTAASATVAAVQVATQKSIEKDVRKANAKK